MQTKRPEKSLAFWFASCRVGTLLDFEVAPGDSAILADLPVAADLGRVGTRCKIELNGLSQKVFCRLLDSRHMPKNKMDDHQISRSSIFIKGLLDSPLFHCAMYFLAINAYVIHEHALWKYAAGIGWTRPGAADGDI